MADRALLARLQINVVGLNLDKSLNELIKTGKAKNFKGAMDHAKKVVLSKLGNYDEIYYQAFKAQAPYSTGQFLRHIDKDTNLVSGSGKTPVIQIHTDITIRDFTYGEQRKRRMGKGGTGKLSRRRRFVASKLSALALMKQWEEDSMTVRTKGGGKRVRPMKWRYLSGGQAHGPFAGQGAHTYIRPWRTRARNNARKYFEANNTVPSTYSRKAGSLAVIIERL